MQPLEVLIQIDGDGRLNIRTTTGAPLAMVLGAMELAKVILTKPLVAEEKKVAPAPAGALRVLNGG